MKVVAIVPIKLNSQRLPHKNILSIAGHPMCWHICNTLSKVKKIEEVYVYCSTSTIKEFLPQKIKYKERPEWLDRDEIKGFDIYREFIKEVEADIYVLAHTTSPFISRYSIENALEHVLCGENDSAFSAERIQTFAWYRNQPINYELNDVPRTQDMEPIWIETSGFYIFRKEVFIDYSRRIGLSPYIQEVSGIEAIDIDERKDYEYACKIAELFEAEVEEK